jgi:Phage integrase, N-terminal SAM-like domain
LLFLPQPNIGGLSLVHIPNVHIWDASEETYVQWIRRYILFHSKRHPKEMGKAEIEAFLPQQIGKDSIVTQLLLPLHMQTYSGCL